MKPTLFLFFTFFFIQTYAQVGIGTTAPDASAALHINSTDTGVLIPKLSDANRAGITLPQNGLIIYNTTSNEMQYNSGTTVAPIWESLITASSSSYMGKFIISGTGAVSIAGLPFKPSRVKFSAHANVEVYDLSSDNGVGNNSNTIANSFGSMDGYAQSDNGAPPVISQQVIYVGGSGASVNDISRYASSSYCIGLRYSNNNGDSLGLTTAELTSFNIDGFSLNVINHTDNVVVIFEAFR